MSSFYPQYDSNWRIGLDGTALLTGWFLVLGLSVPETFDFEDYTAQTPQSQGGVSEQGYKNLSLVWNDMLPLEAYVLRTLLTTTTNKTIFLTVPRNDAQKCREMDWIDISGIYRLPKFVSPPNSRGLIYSPVNLIVTNITIVNSPASGI